MWMNKIIIKQYLNGEWVTLGFYELKFINDEVERIGDKIAHNGSCYISQLEMIVNSSAGPIKIEAEKMPD
jgi:hypothetical protein